ncbi:MAG: hypothetical protein PW788_09205 [Micavibrio sp.]|nr:hypothetical protein [Micavibrio sp.]
MINEFPDLNEAFSRYAKNYIGGNVLYFIDGSGGSTVAYGSNVNPNPIICTLESALAVQNRLKIKTFALYWGEPSGPKMINMKGSEDAWMGQIPNGQTLLKPSLDWLEEKLRTGHLDLPLHIIFVSDGIITDDANSSMESIDRLRRVAGISIDIAIAEATIREEHNLRAPLSALAATLNRMDEAFPVGIAHVDGPDKLKEALRDFINSRMAPEGLAGITSEQCFAKALQGVAKAVKPLATLNRWKKI